MSLRNGIDLLALINDPNIPFTRILNIFESLLVDFQAVRLSLDLGDKGNFYDNVQEIKKGGTIEDSKAYSTPVKKDTLNFVEPTENGYPGLLPPVGTR